MEEARQIVDAASGQVVLVQHHHLRPHLGSPSQPRNHRHRMGFEHPRLKHQDDMAIGGGEVVHIAGARQADDLGVVQAAVWVQPPDHGPVARQPHVPDRTVPAIARMGLERHALQVVAQGDEALRRQVRSVHGQGRAGLPQGPDAVPGDHDGGVGRIGVVVGADAGARVALCSEAGRDHGVQFGLGATLGRIGEPGLQRRLSVLDAEGAHHAVAVEPVGGRAARPPEPGRPIAIEGARQPRRRAAVDQAHGLARQVCGDIGGGHGPVGAGGGVEGGGCPNNLGRGHGGGQGGGARQEGAAGGGHGRISGFGGVCGAYFRSMDWTASPLRAKRARSQLAGPMFPTALLEKAKGSVGMPKGLVFILPSPFRS